MRGLNQVHLIGNVGADPEVRTAASGSRVATLSLATTRAWKDRDGTKQEKTEWHRLVVWGTLADVVDQYVRRGDKLYVSGRIEYRKWEDREGITRYTTEINVQELLMLGSPRGSEDDGGGAAGRRERDATSKAKRAPQEPEPNEFDDFPAALADEDDELPF